MSLNGSFQLCHHVINDRGNVRMEHPVKLPLKILVKIIGKNFTFFGADALHPFFSRVGHFVQGKNHIKIAGQKFSYPVVDTDQVTPLDGFLNLRVI